MRNNMSDWDAKKAFTTKYLYKSNYMPQIYIDDYWNYYIEEHNLTQVWNKFLKQFRDDNLTYATYMDEYNRLLDEVPKLLTTESDKNKIIDIIDNRLNSKENSVMSCIEDLSALPEGNYISVDIHSAFDEALKYIGIFSPIYINTNDIIKDISKHSIFNDNKRLRCDIYQCAFDESIVQGLFKICSEILLEDIYKSNQKLKDIKELTLIGKGRGDSYYYKINDNYDVTDILGEYEYNNIKYHIDYCTVKDIIMLNERYKCRFELDKNYKLRALYLYDTNGHRTENPFLTHLAIKLFTGGELNEKDLAVGYEDRIFFHWDKSEI